MSEKAMTRDVVRTEVAPAERTEDGPMFAPNVDIFEDAGALVLYADMPGVDPAQIDVRFEGRTLILDGRVAPRLPENATVHIQEYGVGSYHRSFEVSESVDGSAITAEYFDGVLRVHLPKTEAARPRRIAVRSS